MVSRYTTVELSLRFCLNLYILSLKLAYGIHTVPKKKTRARFRTSILLIYSNIRQKIHSTYEPSISKVLHLSRDKFHSPWSSIMGERGVLP